MIKKLLLYILVLAVFSSCGYQPIYSSKNLNFGIGNIEKNNNSLNNKFVKKILALSNKNSNNKIDFEIQTEKKISTKSKNSKGDALVFEIEIVLEILNIKGNSNDRETFTRKTTFKNSDDKFKLKQYEKELEEILLSNLVKDLFNYLSNIQ